MSDIKLGLLLQLSLRNLRRNQRRTQLTLLVIGSTLAISLIASRYAVAVMDLWKDGTVDTGTAHVQFHSDSYRTKQDGLNFATTLQDGLKVESDLASDRRVVALVKRLKFEGLVIGDNGSTYFLGTAVQPQQELKVSPRMYNPPYDQGDFVKDGDGESVVVGRALAKLLKLKIGDSVTLLAQTANGSANAWDVRVDGILDVPLPNFSKHAVYMNLELAQKLIRLPQRYTELAVRLRSQDDMAGFLNDYRISAQTEHMQIAPWWDIEPLISRVESIWNTVAGLLCALLAVSAVLTVVNVIYMIVNERVVEIGTLMAIGAKSRTVAMLFAAEGLCMGLVGGLVGMLVANIVIASMGYWGIPFESPFGSGVELVHPQTNLVWNVISVGMAALIAGLCAVPPALKASGIQPASAFRGVT